MKYILMPFLAWVIAGMCKFIINYLRVGKEAFKMVGYGGFPSTHTTIVSSTVFLCGFQEGFNTPYFSLGISVLLIVIIDAHGLRNKVGQQAKILNQIQQVSDVEQITLREKMGHSWSELAGGMLLGVILAMVIIRI